jgi:hypothetical protein
MYLKKNATGFSSFKRYFETPIEKSEFLKELKKRQFFGSIGQLNGIRLDGD